MKIYKGLLVILLTATFGCATAFSQDMTKEKPEKEIREIAKEDTNFWIKELGLTGKQARLMEKEILDFQRKKEELLLSKMQEEEKQKRILALQRQENAHIRDILTKPQFEKYLFLQQQRFHQKDPRDKSSSGEKY